MKNDRTLDRQLAKHPAVGSEPKRFYLWGRVHPHRARLRNLPMEVRVYLNALRRRARPKGFILYGRPRSGTTLLMDLLGQVPGVQSSGELYHSFLLFPRGFLAALLPAAKEPVFGFKLLSYQLCEVHKIRKPIAFFRRAEAKGFRLIYIRRGTFAQTLSLAKAQATGVYFVDGDVRQHVRIDPDYFVELLIWNDKMLSYEAEVVRALDHVEVDYERDLRDPAGHQALIDRLCADLGIASFPVAARLRRTGGEDGAIVLDNLPELRAATQAAGLAHLLP
mgnify:CR=1 FL=1